MQHLLTLLSSCLSLSLHQVVAETLVSALCMPGGVLRSLGAGLGLGSSPNTRLLRPRAGLQGP